MPKQKIVIILFFIICIIDAIGVFFPDVIDRMYTTYFPIPILLWLYMVSVKKYNWYYISGLLCAFFGVIFFNIDSYYKFGIVCYALGVLSFIIIALKHAAVISSKSIYIAAVPFFFIYTVPLFLYADAVQSHIFNYIIFYVFFVGAFFLITSLVYFNRRNIGNCWLFLSGLALLISTIVHGYVMFFGYVTIIDFGVIVTYLMMQYAMYRYMLYYNLHPEITQ